MLLRNSLLAFLSVPLTTLTAQDLGGGAPASHGRVPRFVLENWIPGAPSALEFRDLPAGVTGGTAILSGSMSPLGIPGIGGTLIPDLARGLAVPMGVRANLPTVPASLSGHSLFVQGLYLDPTTGPGFTDASRADFFEPVIAVSTRTAIESLDLLNRRITGAMVTTNSVLVLSPNRRHGYGFGPGTLIAYDVTTMPATQLGTIAISPAARAGLAFTPDGLQLFVPHMTGIDIVDTNSASPTYHSVVATISTPIGGYGLTGPMAVAVTPDASRLFIAYGEWATFPAPSTVGVIDLMAPGYPHRSIAVTTGGSLLGLVTRTAIVVSPDGGFVYTVDVAFPPGHGGTIGYQAGALVNVIDATTENEVSAIPTFGQGQEHLAIDRLGRNLYLPQIDHGGIGQLLRIDTDRRSATRHTLAATIQLDSVPYQSFATGPKSVTVTPDGSTVLVGILSDSLHRTPVVVTVDSRTDRITGTPITVGLRPYSIAAQQF